MIRGSLVLGVVFLLISVVIIPASANNIEPSFMQSSNGNILYVGGSGPGNYSTIKSAIADADDGDTVFVFNRYYNEYDIFIDKSINLIGEDKYNTIIKGNYGEEDVITIRADGVFVSNFMIYGTSGSQIGDSCIRIESINNLIKENIFKESESGILICGNNHQYDGPNLIIDCAFYDNHGTGIFIDQSKDCTVDNCYFKKTNWGVFIQQSTYNKVLNCTFDGGDSIWGIDAEYNLIDNCKFSYAEKSGGISFHFYQDGNIIKNCQINSQYNCISYLFYSGQDNSIQNCSIKAGGSKSDGIYLGCPQNNFEVINCTIEGAENGIYFSDDITNCHISKCRFLNNEKGIFFSRNPILVDVFMCHFSDNNYAIRIDSISFLNKFHCNNFINSNLHVITSSFYYVLFSFYWRNYWDDYIGIGPYHIYGLFNWDLFPAKEPYDIGV